MADDVDRASELEEARVLKSLGAITREITDFSASIDCIDCGDEIDEDRRRCMPSAKRCFLCQNLYERPRRVRRF